MSITHERERNKQVIPYMGVMAEYVLFTIALISQAQCAEIALISTEYTFIKQ